MIANEGEAGAAHVWVNAIDGSIIKTEKSCRENRNLSLAGGVRG